MFMKMYTKNKIKVYAPNIVVRLKNYRVIKPTLSKLALCINIQNLMLYFFYKGNGQNCPIYDPDE